MTDQPATPATGGGVEAFVEALTPSTETKAAYIGEVSFWTESFDENPQKIAVPWTAVKEVMALIKARALSRSEGAAEGVEKRVERVVRDHFYPGPLAGSAARLSAALIAEFGLASAPASPAGDPGWLDRRFTKYELPNTMSVSFDREDEGLTLTLWNEAGDPILCHTLRAPASSVERGGD